MAISQLYNRYPGAKPFETDQEHIFFGRDNDKVRLHRLIKLEPLVVLYAKSGMGKSSLLNAGIIPLVKSEGEYLPINIRFKAWTEGKKEMPDYIARKSIAPKGSASTYLDTLIYNEPSLWHDLKELQLQSKQKVVLIFDQFEELFTYPKAAIDRFKLELAEALYSKIPERYREILEKQIEDDACELTETQIAQLEMPIEVRIVMAIRSDRMSLLNELTDFLPTILKNCFELPSLSIDAARQAILEPARRPKKLNDTSEYSTETFDFNEAAIKKIIFFLTKDETERIESTQLQIICQSIEKKVKIEGQVITEESLGNLNEVIENYYYEQLKELGDETAQLSARHLIEEGLIFEEEERRLSLYEGQIFKTYGITPEVLRELVDAHLLRAEPSLQGGYTYELSHDTLVAPVLKAKYKRKETERIIAEEKANSLREAELEGLKQQAIIEKKRRQKATTLAIGATIALFFALGALVLAYFQYQRAEQRTRYAELLKEKAENEQRKSDTLLIRSNSMLEQIQKQTGIILEEKNKSEKALTETEIQKKKAQEALSEAQNKEQARKEEEEKRKAEERKNIDAKIQDIVDLIKVAPEEARKRLKEALLIAPNNPRLLKLQDELK
jgi:hypothetical protein